MTNPEALLDRSVSDPAVTRQDDKAKPPYDLKPLIVIGAPGHFRETRVPGMHDTSVEAVECARQSYVCLIGEEPDVHRDERGGWAA
ncbi:MAG: hypothetical protein F4Y12_04265 [Acidimicrobiaceae bacterium]|nr:hypothetical protein [Acidimicrobiaceae bacterium]